MGYPENLSNQGEEMLEFLGERGGESLYKIQHISARESSQKLADLCMSSRNCWQVLASNSQLVPSTHPSFQLSTADCSLISRGKHNSLFRKISCILVNWGVGEREVKKRVTMSRFQISCILVKWGGGREKGGG